MMQNIWEQILKTFGELKKWLLIATSMLVPQVHEWSDRFCCRRDHNRQRAADQLERLKDSLLVQQYFQDCDEVRTLFGFSCLIHTSLVCCKWPLPVGSWNSPSLSLAPHRLSCLFVEEVCNLVFSNLVFEESNNQIHRVCCSGIIWWWSSSDDMHNHYWKKPQIIQLCRPIWFPLVVE